MGSNCGQKFTDTHREYVMVFFGINDFSAQFFIHSGRIAQHTSLMTLKKLDF